MAKRQSFADKANKKAHLKMCPICNSAIDTVRMVDPAYSSDKKSWKFKDKIVDICKCNEKAILG